MDYQDKWHFPYAFPNTLPGSFCQAASSLTPGARDKDRIGDLIGRSIALEAPHVVSALSGYATNHYPLLANILVLAGSGFLDVSSCPIWIEHNSSETVDYLDQIKDLKDETILTDSFVGVGRTGYCFFVPDDKPELTGVIFVCSSRTMDRMGLPTSRSGESLSFLPYIAYIDRSRLAEQIRNLTPTRLDRLYGRLYPGKTLTSMEDVEAVLIEAVRFAPMNDIMADAKVLNSWSDAEQAQYVEQSFKAVSSALFRAVSCLILLQLPGITAGLPGNIAFVVNGENETEAVWKTTRFKTPVAPRVINLMPCHTGQTFVNPDDYPDPEDEPEQKDRTETSEVAAPDETA